MDSRDYICPLTIDCLSDIPADFEKPPGLPASVVGVFLPQSDPDWFGGTTYPAKVILLDRDRLLVIPHPEAQAPSVCRPLGDVESVECGRALLLGWMRFRGHGCEQLLTYNRRSAATVEKFLVQLRTRWLSVRCCMERPHDFHFGEPLSDKFAHTVSTELEGGGEGQVIRFHQSAVRMRRRRILEFETWCPGDLVVVTDRRVLWITERQEGAYLPYGAVSRSAPLDMLIRISSNTVEGRTTVNMGLRSGETWTLPANPGSAGEARAFTAATAEALNTRGPGRPPQDPVGASPGRTAGRVGGAD